MKRMQRDPFTLMTFHRVLIGSATAACIFFGIWQILHIDDGRGGSIAFGVVSWLVAGGLIVYLWRIRNKQL
jgi:hypothetical protein